jgi:hypothetical protein
LGQFVPQALAALPEAMTKYALELGFLLSGPWGWFNASEIQRRFERMVDPIVSALEMARALVERRVPDRELARAVARLLNTIWELDTLFLRGADLVRALQDALIASQRPEGDSVANSFTIYNDQRSHEPMRHGEFERLIESYEFLMDPAAVDGFVDEVLALVRRSPRALVVTINVRFTRSTRALIGMQQFVPLTGYVEIWTVRDLEGNRDFHRSLEVLASERLAKPHWGHYHSRYGPTRDFGNEYAGAARFRAAIERLSAPGPDYGTFKTRFLRDRGLLVT